VQVAKNIVLAGVGSVTLVDDTPASQRAPGNFLVHADADPNVSVAEVCVETLRDMNPLVKVSWLPGAPYTFADSGNLAEFNVVLLSGQAADVVDRTDQACAAAGVAFYAAVSRGIFGWVFANLHEHSFVVEASCL
jgi:ubiquitin-like 1-activating enzyme E1 A